jgi:hypothetical protein
MPNTLLPDGNGVMSAQGSAPAPLGQKPPGQPQAATDGQNPMAGSFTDAQLLSMWNDRWKKECFDQRWIFERQWMRNIWYLLNRQWIYFDSKRGQWQDKRLAKWMPRPVTNILKEAVDSVKANFALINYGATARPLGQDPKAIITASVADDYSPILWDEHHMDQIMADFDWWMLATGNTCLHTAVNYDRQNGITNVAYETCLACQQESLESDIAKAMQKCPQCGATDFQPSTNPDGSPKISAIALPAGYTMALSPFEYAFPLMYAQFREIPLIVRMRWRDKSYYEQHPEFSLTYARTLSFTKTPKERTMQIFKTLPFQSDMGIAPPYFGAGGANSESEGIVEYDIWVKPCEDFPEGQVIRIAGDANPVIIHSEKESLPGPLPYHEADGNPLFPFFNARYSTVGGRAIGSALIDPAIQKQDQINQLDAHSLMIIGRMANPIWLEPKGAEVEKFTGEPGLVVKWNPLVAGGNAKPERIPGEGINPSVFAFRQSMKQEAEELMGTYDILKGERPAGVEAYAAMSLLLERAQGRHASAYKERGTAVKGWYKAALEIEREFGPDKRLKAVMGPNKGWAFKQFQKADLSGSVEIIIEDGTLTPKTSLGERAAIDHLAQLGVLNPADPDMQLEILRKFGQESLMPSVDAQVQEAWMNMDKFEQFLGDPQAIMKAQQDAPQIQAQAIATGQPLPPVGPLVYRPWYNPQVHRNELIKWCLSDRGRMVFQKTPQAIQMITAYLAQIDLALAQERMGIIDAAGVPINTQPPNGQQPPTPSGGAPQQQGANGRAQAMRNSNQNAGAPGGTNPPGPGGAGASSGAVSIAQRSRAMSYLNRPGQGS